MTKLFTADEFVDVLTSLRERIPEYVQLSPKQRHAMRRAANLNPQFVSEAISAVGMSNEIEMALGMSVADMQMDNSEAERWSAAEQELEATRQGVHCANLVRHYRVGVASLQAYNIAAQLIRRPEHADVLLSVVQSMTALRKFGR